MIIRLNSITWWMGPSLPPFNIFRVDPSGNFAGVPHLTLVKRSPHALDVIVEAPGVPALFLESVDSSFAGVPVSPIFGRTKMMLSLGSSYVEVTYTVLQQASPFDNQQSRGARADARADGPSERGGPTGSSPPPLTSGPLTPTSPAIASGLLAPPAPEVRAPVPAQMVVLGSLTALAASQGQGGSGEWPSQSRIATGC